MPPRPIIPNDPNRWGSEEDADAIARSAENARELTDEERASLEEVDEEEDDGT